MSAIGNLISKVVGQVYSNANTAGLVVSIAGTLQKKGVSYNTATGDNSPTVGSAIAIKGIPSKFTFLESALVSEGRVVFEILKPTSATIDVGDTITFSSKTYTVKITEPRYLEGSILSYRVFADGY